MGLDVLHTEATATQIRRHLFNGQRKRDANGRRVVVASGSREWVFPDEFMGLLLANPRFQQHCAETLKRMGVHNVSVALH